MDFILTENKHVIYGPKPYNKKKFESVITDDTDYEDNVSLPFDNTGYYSVSDTIEIYPLTSIVIPSYTSLYQQLAGPFYDFIEGVSASSYYTVLDKPIDVIKQELKAIVTNNRYLTETQGMTVTIQNTDVFLYTSREDRNMYLQAFQLGAGGNTWKFKNNIWLTLSIEDLQTIVITVLSHVQNCFDWESNKTSEIENCNSLEDIKNITLTHPNQIINQQDGPGHLQN